MSERAPSFQFYPKDWLDWRVLRMSDAAQGVYVRLLAFMWKDSRDQCSIPDDDAQIAKVLGKRPSSWRKLRAEIQWTGDPLLHQERGRLVSHRLRKERKKQDLRRKALSEAGSQGAARRWRGHKPGHSEATPAPMAPDSSSTAPSSSTPTATGTSVLTASSKKVPSNVLGEFVKAARSANVPVRYVLDKITETQKPDFVLAAVLTVKRDLDNGKALKSPGGYFKEVCKLGHQLPRDCHDKAATLLYDAGQSFEDKKAQVVAQLLAAKEG